MSPRAPRRPGPLGRMLVAAAAAIALAVLPLAASGAAASVRCATPAPTAAGGVDLSASVVGPSTSPCAPSGAGSGTGAPVGTGATQGSSGTRGGSAGTGASSGTGTGTGAGSAPASVAPSPTSTAAPAGEVSLAGVLGVSGLTGYHVPSLEPFGGEVALSFTVRNTSQSTIDATADFWMEGPFGNRVGQVDGIRVDELKPGESRVVTADVTGAGQWTLLTAHARLTPPAEVEGTTLTPLVRDATVFAFPWLAAVVVLVAAIAWALIVLVRRRQATWQPVGATT